MTIKVSEELERELGNLLQRHGDTMAAVNPVPITGEIYGVELLAPDKKTRRRWTVLEIVMGDYRGIMLTPEGAILPTHISELKSPGLVRE